MRKTICQLGLIATMLLPAATAVAQTNEPPGPYVVDARGVFARFRDNETVAGQLLVPSVNLPTSGLGVAAGAHWYPLRAKLITIGIGGEWLTARGSESLAASDETTPEVTVRDSLTAISPQLSINFGGRNGWSYISGGLGRGKLTMERADNPTGSSWRRAINYGVGARWFTTGHVAVSLDIRWYAIDEQPATLAQPLIPHMTLLMLSGGIALR
jgi:hypothetical protein